MNASLVVYDAHTMVEDTCFNGYLETHIISELASPQELYDAIPDRMREPFRDIVLQHLDITTRKGLRAACKKFITLAESERNNSSHASKLEEVALLLFLNNVRTIRINTKD